MLDAFKPCGGYTVLLGGPRFWAQRLGGARAGRAGLTLCFVPVEVTTSPSLKHL
jgi:hypothetical protein